MSNMTGLGRYQKAMAMEAEGLAANQVAYKAGYKNTQAWYAAKAYYKKHTEDFNQRAKGEEIAPSPDPLLAAIETEKTMAVSDGLPQAAQKKATALKIEKEIKAQGNCLRYRLQKGELLMASLTGDRFLRIKLSDVPELIAELQELMQIGGRA